MENNKHYGLKELLNKGKNKKVEAKPYNEKHVILLLKKFYETKDENIKKQIIENCYPIIFSVLKKFGKKINTANKILDNEDLYNEGILVIDKCIDNFKIFYNVKFLTFVWVSLYRKFFRFTNNNLIRPSRFFISIDAGESLNEEYEECEKINEVLENKESQQKQFEKLSLKINNAVYEIDYEIIDKLNDLQKNLLILKIKKYKINEILKILNISVNKYYKVFNEIKKKMRRNKNVRKNKAR